MRAAYNTDPFTEHNQRVRCMNLAGLVYWSREVVLNLSRQAEPLQRLNNSVETLPKIISTRRSQRYKCSNKISSFLFLSFRRVLYVICFLMGNSPVPEF